MHHTHIPHQSSIGPVGGSGYKLSLSLAPDTVCGVDLPNRWAWRWSEPDPSSWRRRPGFGYSGAARRAGQAGSDSAGQG
jgi:hypothetical protein